MTERAQLSELWARLGDQQQELLHDVAQQLVAEPEGVRAELVVTVRALDDRQVAHLLGVARSMTLPIEETIGAESDLVTPEFAAEFRARLQAHHATHSTPMDRLSFENAFLAASRAAGRHTSEAPSRTTRFFDATVDGAQTALKTEGAKSMKAASLHISKLSEAAWIQDMRSGRTRWEKTMEFLDEFLKAVDRIFVLRCYRADPAPHYELVEIPTSHFELLRDTKPADFMADSPRVAVGDSAGPILELRLDRSDSKITISKIVKDRCLVHGDWRLTGLAEEPVSPWTPTRSQRTSLVPGMSAASRRHRGWAGA